MQEVTEEHLLQDARGEGEGVSGRMPRVTMWPKGKEWLGENQRQGQNTANSWSALDNIHFKRRDLWFILLKWAFIVCEAASVGLVGTIEHGEATKVSVDLLRNPFRTT